MDAVLRGDRMNRIDWIKAKALLLPLKHEYKENFGLGLMTEKVMLVIISVLLALVEEKIQER